MNDAQKVLRVIRIFDAINDMGEEELEQLESAIEFRRVLLTTSES